MTRVFKTSLFVPEKNIRLFLNESASKNRIIRAFKSLARVTKPGDKVFFYYSGHGIRTYDDLKGEKSTSLLLSTGEKISARLFGNMVKKIKALSVSFLDSCHSGGMISQDFIFNVKKISNPVVNRRAYFVASSKSEETSMTIPLYKHSRFTYFLSRAILRNRADLNKDGKLSLQEVFSWSKKQTLLFGEKYGALHNPVIYGKNPSSVILNEKTKRDLPSNPEDFSA